MQVSILSERRVYHPYGLNGGEDAQCGQNIWVRRMKRTNSKGEDEWFVRELSMGAKNTARMPPGDRIIVKTAGGGGWGKVGEKSVARKTGDARLGWKGGSYASRVETQETSV